MQTLSGKLAARHHPIDGQAVTTEHFSLQSARNAIATESVGRATIYLGTVSSVLIAMGFIGQLLQLSPMFMLIGVVLLGALFALGVATSVRLTQLGIDDMACQRAINRLRHWYLESSPELSDYFMMSDRDDVSGMGRNETTSRSGWQFLFAITGTLALINSVIGAVALAIILHAGFDVRLRFCMMVAAAFAVVSVTFHAWLESRAWQRAGRRMPVKFPSSH